MAMKDEEDFDRGATYWWDRIFVVPSAKMVFCSIPQVDSVDWVNHLERIEKYTKKLEGKPGTTGREEGDDKPLPFVPLSTFTTEEAREVLRSFKKVIWVRDPLERILRAWKDRLQSLDHFSRQEYLSLLQERPDLTEDRLRELFPVPLEKFFSFLTLQPSTFGFDSHWKPYRDLCSICQIDYDYILYRETEKNKKQLPYEVEYVIRHALAKEDCNDLPKFTVAQPTIMNTTEMGSIPLTLLHRVMDIYKLDYALFELEQSKDSQF